MDKPLSLAAKLLLIGAGGLAVVAGPALFLFPRDTASYFAWTINHPLTPIFMGANYFGGIGALWAVRSNRWSVARVLLPGIFVFAITQLLATLLHVSIFNWAHPIAWAWLFVYISSPLAALFVYWQMERGDRSDAVAAAARPLRPLMLICATVSGLVGLALWIWPAISPTGTAGAVPWWAWTLTPLTARVVGGWYLAAAALYVTLAQRHTREAIHVALLGTLCATGLELIGAILYRDAFNGPPLVIGLYLLNVVANIVIAIFAWLRWSPASPMTSARAMEG